MNRFRCGKVRLLYLLALAQLVGGPLVLLQVTWFCKLTLREAPRAGWRQAALLALHDTGTHVDAATAPAPVKKQKSPDHPLAGKSKTPPVLWQTPAFRTVNHETRIAPVWLARVWTPAWPLAPPGPPPRMG